MTSSSPTTRSRALIFHGYGATPQDHWFGWLAEQLDRAGVPSTVPALPNSDAPNREAWSAAVREAVGTPDGDTILVAHSLGCITVLRHLLSLEHPWHLGTLVLVSGFVEKLPSLVALDHYIGDGAVVSELQARIDNLLVVRSDADPYVPTGHTDRLASRLGTSAVIVPDAGHFLASDGVTSVPLIRDSILRNVGRAA